MSGIFDVEPPRWLQEIARPIPAGEIGGLIGMGLAGAYNAAQESKFTKDRADAQEAVGQPAQETKTWLQELPQGLFEARMNLADPLWKVKVAQSGALIQEHRAQAQLALQRADLQAHSAQQEIEDAPKMTQYAKDLAVDPNAVRPSFSSPKYNQLATQLYQQTQKASIDNKKAQNQLDAQLVKASLDEDKLQLAKDALTLKEKTSAATKDFQPKVFSEKLPSGRVVEGVYSPSTGHFQENKEEKTPADTFSIKEANRIRTAISKANVKLAAANAKIRKEPGEVEGITVEIQTLKNQLKDLQSGASTAPVKIGRFDVVPVKP